MAETERFSMGTLRSDIKMQIHTRQAARLWCGRKGVNNQQDIIGLADFLIIANRINIGSRKDDPYSDWWMIRVEEKIDQVKICMENISSEVDYFFSKIPSSFTLTKNINLNPVNLPVYSGSPLGYLAVYILAQYDEIVRKIVLGRHIAVIDHRKMNIWLLRGDHHLRSLFALVTRYRYSGTTRHDFESANTIAQAAIEKYGEVPAEIMNGTKRSRFSPPLRTDSDRSVQEKTDNDEAANDDEGV